MPVLLAPTLGCNVLARVRLSVITVTSGRKSRWSPPWGKPYNPHQRLMARKGA